MCKICTKTNFKNVNGFSKHLRLMHNLSLIEYLIEYENLKIPTCPYCGKKCKFRAVSEFYKTCGNKLCKTKLFKEKTHTKETKELLSKLRIKWLSENPDKHPWKNNNKFISKPCEKLKLKLLENGISFESELMPLPNKNYSIDIAIVERGVGLEVNGNQHYNKDKSLKKYYQKRKQEIEEEGWILYDIHYTKIYDDEFVDSLIFLLNNSNNSKIPNFDFNLNPDNFCQCGKKIKKNSKKCKSCQAKSKRKIKNRPDKETLLKEVNILGYSGTGRKYGVSDNCIRKWLYSSTDRTTVLK